MNRTLLACLLATAWLALPVGAAAADTLVVSDPDAQQVTALEGTIVWISGRFGAQRLMRRTPDGLIAAVAGTPVSRSYRSVDLGKDSDGNLRLTYVRCDAGAQCKSLWNDLDGRRATYRNLTLPGCTINTTVSQWRRRVAYGLSCTGSAANRKRTGLYTRNGSRRPVRLPRPAEAVRFGIRTIESVDLRGTRVAATVADVYEYSFSQNVDGTGMRSFLAAASEGDSDASARGLAIESASTHWTLTDAIHGGDPAEAIIFRRRGDCLELERLVSSPGATQEFEAIDLATESGMLHLVRPGQGIVTHTFAPERACP